jgi:hypothetical protein
MGGQEPDLVFGRTALAQTVAHASGAFAILHRFALEAVLRTSARRRPRSITSISFSKA